MKKYNLGLDLGIASVGWSVIELDQNNEPLHIKDTGVLLVESMEDDKGNLANQKRREARGARRTLRRRQHRISRIKTLIKKELNLENEEIYAGQITNPYALKVKALDEQLTSKELAQILIHYGKHRGYKSNRKNEKDANSDGKILKALESNAIILNENDWTISQYMYSELNGIDKVKNGGDYKYSFTREQYKSEIQKVLENQVKYGLIDEKFIAEYIDIWASQRDFSEGPGDAANISEYAVDFQKTFGICKFDNELRAPRDSVSNQTATLLQKLLNLRYITTEKTGEKLTPELIQVIMNEAEKGTDIKYGTVKKFLIKEISNFVAFENLDLSRDKFKNLVSKFKKDNNLDPIENIDFTSEEFKASLEKRKMDEKIFQISSLKIIKSAFKDKNTKTKFEDLSIEYLDDIVTGLTFYKTDEKIRAYFTGTADSHSPLDWDIYEDVVNEIIPFIPSNFKESASLSLDILRKINPLMLSGMPYDKAMESIGIAHYDNSVEGVVKKRYLPEILKILDEYYPREISNPRVIRVLCKTRSVINAVIKKHGTPYNINIEVARDINLTRSKRNNIMNDQLSNLDKNHAAKIELSKELNCAYSQISKYDIEKYKLWKEQNGVCAYSQEVISFSDILKPDYQIDHIIPYSRTNNNSYQNKTLVKQKENQDKGNKTPLEYMKSNKEKWEKFKQYINNNPKISAEKKKNYLITEITPEMSERSLNDTRFITKILVNILENFLVVENKVNSYKAGYVNYYKRALGVHRYTHSIESPNYRKNSLFVVKDLDVNSKGIKLSFENEDSKEKIEKEIKLKEAKANSQLNSNDLKLNNAILAIINNVDSGDLFTIEVDENGKEHKQFNFTNLKIYEVINKLENMAINEELKNQYLYIFGKFKVEYEKELIKKDRGNHLHHAVDATVVGSMSKSVEQAVSKYEKRREEALEVLRNGNKIKLEEIDKIINDVEEFYDYEDAFLKEKFDKPFETINDEIKIYIYERDNNKQKEKLRVLGITNDDVRVLIPVIQKKKRYGKRIHKETIYGLSNDHKQVTKRIDVKDLKVKKSDDKIISTDAEKIDGKETFARPVYEAVLKWQKEKEKDRDVYPKLANGRIIKKVKVRDSDANKAIPLGNGKYASVEEVVRIDILKKKGEDQLYFVQRQNYNLDAEQKGKTYSLTLWWGREKNHKVVTIDNNARDTEIDTMTQAEFNKIFECVGKYHPGDLIRIEKVEAVIEVCSVVGFTSGSIEVGSVIGDGYDLVKQYKAFSVFRTQYNITCSTIKEITPLKISVLGELSNEF